MRRLINPGSEHDAIVVLISAGSAARRALLLWRLEAEHSLLLLLRQLLAVFERRGQQVLTVEPQTNAHAHEVSTRR